MKDLETAHVVLVYFAIARFRGGDNIVLVALSGHDFIGGVFKTGWFCESAMIPESVAKAHLTIIQLEFEDASRDEWEVDVSPSVLVRYVRVAARPPHLNCLVPINTHSFRTFALSEALFSVVPSPWDKFI